MGNDVETVHWKDCNLFETRRSRSGPGPAPAGHRATPPRSPRTSDGQRRRSQGVLAHLERIVAPFANTLGWHSDFEIETVLKEPDLALEVQKSLPPLGMMTFLVLTKTKAS